VAAASVTSPHTIHPDIAPALHGLRAVLPAHAAAALRSFLDFPIDRP
jgi:hypothetical protein